MKLRFLAALLMFLSSYSPLALIFVVKDLDSKTAWPQHPISSLAILIVALVVCLVTHAAVKKIKGGIPVTVSKVSNKSSDLFTYTIPYMISFYNFNLGDWKTLLSLAIFMLLMFALAYRTQNVFINPVLALSGYGLYECQFDDNGKAKQGLFLSKHDFQLGDTCVIERLSNFLFFVSSVQTKEALK
jgi:hypothetical protein